MLSILLARVSPCLFPLHTARADSIAGFVQQRTIEWETVASLLPVPNDTGSVFVVDGGEFPAWCFRLQTSD